MLFSMGQALRRAGSKVLYFAAYEILAIGSDRMMKAVAESRHTILRPYLEPGH